MKKMHISLALFILFSIVFNNIALSWDNKVTHKDLSEYATESSVLSKTKGDYLRNFGFEQGVKEPLKWNATKTILDWLREGAELEDAGSKIQALLGKARFNNHFHNPLKPWVEAGLSDIQTGESSLKWAQDGSAQMNRVEADWSWQKVREHFYTALTGRDLNGDLMASTQGQREEYFAKTFRGLGHQMHLIQDVAQPDHTRNDAHPEDELLGKNPLNGIAYFETWAKDKFRNLNALRTFAPNPVFPNVPFNVSYNGLAPITQLYDTDKYDGYNASAGINQGLSEYTNANFFTGDTIFAAELYFQNDRHYFPYPKKSSTDLQAYIAQIKPLLVQIAEDGIQDRGIWIKKERDGETIDHFVRTSRWTSKLYKIFGEGSMFYNSFYRDERCYEDYAALLIPRAVGYSAGLIDYFFRGSLEITAPDSYVYSIIDGNVTPQEFTQIKAKVRNTTPNEEIEGCDASNQNCILQAVARYKKIPNYSGDLSNYPPDGDIMKGAEYSYSVSAPITVTSLSSSEPTEFVFDFSSITIPAGITDLSFLVVFKGTLGGEQDIAVAVGMKDLMEPTHHVFWNLTDMFSLNYQDDYHLYTSIQIKDDSNLASLVDYDHDGVFNEISAGEPYIDPYDLNFDVGYMGDPAAYTVPSSAAVTLPSGRFVRLIVLVDRQYNYLRLTWTQDIEPGSAQSNASFEGVVNQEVGGVWQTPTPNDAFRSISQHFHAGVLRCKPQGIDSAGQPVCPYPEPEAIPADLAPYPATINFP